MTRRASRLLIAAGAAAAILAGVLLALPLLVDVNRHRDLIRARAEEALGRKVSLGPMSLTVLPSFGIRVQDPEVEGLLKARSLTVGVRLLPLVFGGAVDVRQVILEHPEVNLERGRDGSWNLPAAGPAAEGATAAREPAGAGAPRPFSLGRLRATGAVIHLRDASRGGAVSPRIDLRLDLTGSASRDGTGALETRFDGRLEADGILLDLRGTVALEAPPGEGLSFDLRVGRASVEIARAREIVAAAGRPWPLPEGLLRSRTLSLSGHLSGHAGGSAPARLVLEDLVVEGADVALSRDRAGRWSVAAAGPAPGARAEASPGRPLPIEIRNLKVTGAAVTLHDEATGGAPADIVLKDVDLLVEELAPGRPLSARIESKVSPGSGRLTLSGTVPLTFDGGAETPVDAEADLRGIEARVVAPYLDRLLGIDAESGTLTLRAKVSGSYPRSLSAAGSLGLEELKAARAPRPVSATVEFDLKASEGAALVTMERLRIASGASRLDVRGTIDNRGAGTLVDLEVPPSSVDAADLTSIMTLAGAASPVEFSSSRPVRLQAKVRGDVGNRASLAIAAGAEASDLTLRHPMLARPLEKVEGRLDLRGDHLEVSGFSGVIGSSDVSGTIDVTGFDAPRVGFSLASRHADFWELMSFLKQEPPATGGGAGAPAAPGPADDPLARVTARGTLSIESGSFGTLAFTGLSTTMALERRVVRLDPVAMKLYAGTMSGSATLDLSRDPAVATVEAKTRGIDADALLAANLQMKGMLSGPLSGDLAITASGAGREAVLRSARGSGTIGIGEGHLGAVNVLKVLSRASDLLGEKSLKEVSGRLAKEGTDFSELTADLTVEGGRILSRRLRLVSPDLELKDDGELDMLAGTLRVAGEILFSERMSRAMMEEGSRAVDYFWDDRKGRVNLPLTLAGPIASPTPSIDWGSAGGRLAGRKVREKVGEKLREAGLGDLLSGRAGRQPAREGTGEPTSPSTAPSTSAGSAAPSVPAAAAASPAPGGGDPSITIEESGFTGNLLMPDLKVKGTLSGTDIARASVRVTDEKGRAVHEESLDGKIGKYYATHDRAAPASINFRVSVEGRALAGSRKGVTVEIVVEDSKGRAASKRLEVSR